MDIIQRLFPLAYAELERVFQNGNTEPVEHYNFTTVDNEIEHARAHIEEHERGNVHDHDKPDETNISHAAARGIAALETQLRG